MAILRKSLSSFLSSLPALLLVSLLLLTLRSALLAGTLRLSSLPDTNPLLRSFLSRLSPASTSTSSSPTPRFFHLSPAVPLSDDIFPSSRSLGRRLSLNSSFTFPIPLLLSPNSSPGARARLRSRPSPDSTSRILFSLPDSEFSFEEDTDRATKAFSLGKNGLELVYILSLLSSAHAAALLGFILCYAAALGVVFYCTAWSFLSRPVISLTEALSSGARMGFRRLIGFVFLKWAIRDAVLQFLCIWFFAGVNDQNKLFKIFIKVKLMPFSLTAVSGDEDPQLHGLLFVWGFVDFVVSVVFIFVPWVVVVDDNFRRRVQEVVKEGVFLLTLVPGQSLWIKCLEMAACGRLGRVVLSALGGRRFAILAQAMLEVYFMVVWLILYLEARKKDCDLGGRRFRREELEWCIDKLQ